MEYATPQPPRRSARPVAYRYFFEGEFLKKSGPPADLFPMSTLDRYKKSGGFSQLLSVLEGSTTQKRDQFFALIGQESKIWEEALRKKMVTLEKILAWPPEHITDVFVGLPHLTTAMVFHGYPQEKIDFYLKYFPPQEKRKVAELMKEKAPTAGEKAACVSRVLAEVRGQISKGTLKVEKWDPEMAIAQDIEHLLEHGGGSGSKKKEDAKDSTGPTLVSASSSSFESDGESNESGLRFELPPKTDVSNLHDIDALKKKVHQLSKENEALRYENSMLKGKLDQIRRIA